MKNILHFFGKFKEFSEKLKNFCDKLKEFFEKTQGFANSELEIIAGKRPKKEPNELHKS